MTYTLNPHRHVKIWISQNKDIFLTKLNQHRLIKQRYNNPQDEIHLLYESRLLSTTAKADLKAFCAKYNIIYKKITNIKAKTIRETKLLNIYEQEIQNFGQGGDPGVASDVLRWLSDCYRSGIYSDFDVKVNTSMLPATINIEKPIVIDIGSYNLGSHDLISLNNHIIGVNEDEMDLELIQVIQDQIIEAYTNPSSIRSKIISHYKSVISHSKTVDDLLKANVAAMKAECETIDISKDVLQSRKALVKKKSQSIEIDHRRLANDPRMQQELHERLAQSEFISMVRGLDGCLGTCFFSAKQVENIRELASLSDAELGAYHKDQLFNQQYSKKVTYSTGPIAITFGLFQNLFLKTEEMNDKVAPFSLLFNKIRNCFKTTNSVDLHTDPTSDIKAKMFINNCDMSWVPGNLETKRIKQKEMNIGNRKNQYSKTLPGKMQRTKEKIESHIKKIQSDLDGCFGWYRQEERTEKIRFLTSALHFFNQNNVFDCLEYKKAIVDMDTVPGKKTTIYASFFSSKTQKLVERLEKQASVCYLYDI